MNALEANFYEVHPDLQQAIAYPVDDSTARRGSAAPRPAGEHWSKRYSPLLRNEWLQTDEVLQRYARETDGSPYDGIHMDYVNPERSDENTSERKSLMRISYALFCSKEKRINHTTV